MSTADIAVIAIGADQFAFLGAGTFLAWKVLGRVRVVAPTKDAPGEPETAVTAPRAVVAPVPLPPQAAQRQDAYNKLRGGNRTAAEAAAELGITAPRTAYDYEARYKAANGAGVAS